jgi:hypothetical protein
MASRTKLAFKWVGIALCDTIALFWQCVYLMLRLRWSKPSDPLQSSNISFEQQVG